MSEDTMDLEEYLENLEDDDFDSSTDKILEGQMKGLITEDKPKTRTPTYSNTYSSGYSRGYNTYSGNNYTYSRDDYYGDDTYDSLYGDNSKEEYEDAKYNYNSSPDNIERTAKLYIERMESNFTCAYQIAATETAEVIEEIFNQLLLR